MDRTKECIFLFFQLLFYPNIRLSDVLGFVYPEHSRMRMLKGVCFLMVYASRTKWK